MKNLLYIDIAAKMEEAIRKGTYKAGDRLPSVRTLHRQQQVSIGTALQAYYRLLDKGVIVAKEKSGYFVKQISLTDAPLPKTIKPSLSVREVQIDQLIQRLWKDSPAGHFVSFANALPDQQLLPLNGIKRALQHASRDPGAKYLSYEEPGGDISLRQAIAKRAFTWGGALNPEEIVITNGATEAINLCLKAVTRPGDTVLIQTPCYYGTLQSLEYLQLKALAIPCDAVSGIRLEDLENACSKQRGKVKAILLVSNFNNPNGASLDSIRKRQIAALARREKIPVIEDDLYGDVFLDGGRRPDTIHNYDTDGWVLLCSSFSKTLVPGFRIGWCAPGRFHYEVQRFKYMSNLVTPPVLQKAVCEMLRNGLYDRHLRVYRNTLNTNLSRTITVIQQSFPDGTAFTRPKGGLVSWVELPGNPDTAALQEVAFRKGVAFAPGVLFSATGAYKNYIRISYANAWTKKTENALKRLGQLCQATVY